MSGGFFLVGIRRFSTDFVSYSPLFKSETWAEIKTVVSD